MDGAKKNEKPVNPRARANPISALTFCWVFNLFFLGSKRELEIGDLYEPLDEHRSNVLGDRLENAWNLESENAAKKKRNPSLLRVIISVFKWDIMMQGMVLSVAELLVRVSQPLFLGKLIRYFIQQKAIQEEKIVSMADKITLEDAYFYACGVLFCTAINVLCIHPYMMGVLHIGMKVRVGCCSLIYRKALRLSKTALGQTTVGQIVNLLSNDVNRYDISAIFMHYLWIGPFQTVIATYFIWQEIGVASLIGVSTLLVIIPFQAFLGKKSSTLRLKTAIRTDERVRLMNEIISGIQVIKMYTWEKPFAKLVSKARRKEIDEIRKKSYVSGTLLSFIIFHTRFAVFLSIFSYVFLGDYINAEKVFVVTSYFNILKQTMTVFFPQGIGQVAEALISTKRLQNFMMYDEIAKHHTPEISEHANGVDKNKIEKNRFSSDTEACAVNMKNVVAKWTPESTDNTLNDVSIKFPSGGVTAVIGLVGAGKSSLFHAILKELPIKSGNISVNGRISYASQEPWLFAGSIRQNILFGEPYDKQRYRSVTKVCALATDFEQLPYGDKTIVGDRGVSLSGGQRARINLARAVYKKADIYLFDDPLSAVDSHVGKHLFEDCIIDYLKNKTRILITHQLQYLNVLNHIIMLDGGNVIAEGSYKELQDSGTDFAKLLSSLSEDEDEKEAGEAKPLHQRQPSVQSIASSTLEDGVAQQEPPEVAEMRSTGTVGWDVYGAYLTSGGSLCLTIFCLLLCVFTQVFASGGDYWITYWVNLEEQNNPLPEDQNVTPTPFFRTFKLLTSTIIPNIMNNTTRLLSNATHSLHNATDKIVSSNDNSPINAMPRISDYAPVNKTVANNMVVEGNDDGVGVMKVVLANEFGLPLTREDCLYIFCIITVATIFITLLRSFIFYRMCMKSSMKLHDTMFNSITRATMRFFNTNSAGRILNRFSKDMGSIDEMLPGALIDCIQIGLTLLGIIAVITIVNFWLFMPTLFIGIIFYCIRNFYLSTSRSVKRLEGVTRSPVFSHLNASIQGLTTIRAFKAQHILEKEFDHHQDLHSSAWFMFLATSRAFGYWLDLICILYISIVTLSFLVLGIDTFGGNVGLAISQSIGLTGMFQWGMRQSAELENQMTSVERVLEYSDIEKEPPLESEPDKKPPDSWPKEGKIVFDGVYLKYGPEEPPVLKNLTFTINPGERVGIVGRTGAGKSSLISALYRLVQVDGEIKIDDLDTSTIGLHDIRSKISIIPQEPVLFSGTMRKNLDPFDEYDDDRLWNALEEVELKEAISELRGALNAKMSEGGSNFSVGQRQLVCLARAIVRKNKILILDEATANVDPHTDSLIQVTIRKKFSDCTMLTIAHRLNTVMDSDKVLVMDAGRVVEFDHPHLLLQNKEGYLYKMVQKTGKSTAEVLHKVARDSYFEYIDGSTSNINKIGDADVN